MKKYTRKQICEAIKYWKKQLRNVNEGIEWPTHTPIGGDQYDDPYASLSWGEFKRAVDARLRDSDTVNIQSLVGGIPVRDGYGEDACYVDIIKSPSGEKIIAVNFSAT